MKDSGDDNHEADELEKLYLAKTKQLRQRKLKAYQCKQTQYQFTWKNTMLELIKHLDIQIKRLHEYKTPTNERWYVIHKYLGLSKLVNILLVQSQSSFGGKAAPAYTIVKTLSI